jgi:RNA polymerase sigma factor (sigma-70 family)
MASRPADAQYASQLTGAGFTDERLLDGLRAGSEAAFAELYRAQATGIYNLCLRLLGSPEDAQDVTQDVFVKAYRQLPCYDAGFRVGPWLYRVAVNACYDQLRARKARPSEPLPDEIASPRIDDIERSELGELLEQTLAGLSLRHRTVLLLRDVHGLSHGEIAAALSVSRGATETMLFRARQAFRRTYTTLARTEPHHPCDLARRAVVDSVGGGLSERQRRRILAHAKDCPHCRDTVATWSLGAFGLVAFVHFTPLPAALAAPPFAAAVAGAAAGSLAASGGAAVASGAGRGAAGGAGAGAASGAGVAGATAAAGGVSSGAVSTGAALTAGAVVKASLLAVAAGALAVTGGVSAHHLMTANRHAPATAAVAGRAKVAKGTQSAASAAHLHGKSRPATGALRGKGGVAGRSKVHGTAQGAGHAKSAHASGSAVKAHPAQAVSRARGQTAHQAAKRAPHVQQKPSAKSKAVAKHKKAAKTTKKS